MKTLPIGTKRIFRKIVTPDDLAHFDAGAVHDVYATFALARDAEWSGRLLVLEMKEEGEEGIGTGLTIEHQGPAFVGETVLFESTLIAINGPEVVSEFTASVAGRAVACGVQKQKILPKEKIQRAFEKARNSHPKP